MSLVPQFDFKLKYESVTFVIPISFEEISDEEIFRMTVRRMANAIRVESFSCVRRRPKLSRTVDTAKSQWKNGKHFQRFMGSEVNGQKQEEHVAKQLQRKLEERERESKKFSAWPKN